MPGMSRFDLHRFVVDVFDPQPGETVAVLVDEPRSPEDDGPAWAERREMAARWRDGIEALGGRIGFSTMPLVRYRTGDRVRVERGTCACGRTFRRLAGGILGRVDDMLVVRGVNVFPSAIEGIVRRFPAVAEFLIEVYRRGEMDEVRLLVEATADARGVAGSVQEAVRVDLGIRVDVVPVALQTLPRYELKARRLVRRPAPRESAAPLS